jgi:hypothetical protein
MLRATAAAPSAASGASRCNIRHGAARTPAGRRCRSARWRPCRCDRS